MAKHNKLKGRLSYSIHFSNDIRIINKNYSSLTSFMVTKTKRKALELMYKYGGFMIEREIHTKNGAFIIGEIIRKEDKDLTYDQLWDKYKDNPITVDRRKNKDVGKHS